MGLFHHAPCLHGKPTVCPSCTEFVYPGCWNFDNGAIRKFDDLLLEHGGLPHGLPPCLKVRGWWVVGGGLEQFSVSPRPLGFRFGAKGLGPGLDN